MGTGHKASSQPPSAPCIHTPLPHPFDVGVGGTALHVSLHLLGEQLLTTHAMAFLEPPMFSFLGLHGEAFNPLDSSAAPTHRRGHIKSPPKKRTHPHPNTHPVTSTSQLFHSREMERPTHTNHKPYLISPSRVPPPPPPPPPPLSPFSSSTSDPLLGDATTRTARKACARELDRAAAAAVGCAPHAAVSPR